MRGKLTRQSGAKQTESTVAESISESWAASVLPRREAGAHKWGVGGVVVVAGSPPFAGAAALCCAGAGRSGAGVVSAALPRSIAQVVVGLVPEVTLVILPEGDSNSVAARAAEAIGERLGRSAAMVVGPGLGNDAATAALLGTLFGFTKARGAIGFGTAASGPDTTLLEGTIAKAGKPVVVDADALTWLAEQENWWERVPDRHLVLTPHPGEMTRLVDVNVDEIAADPALIARQAATRWSQTVVLKGGRTVVASADGAVVACRRLSRRWRPREAGMFCVDRLAGSWRKALAARMQRHLAVFVGCRAAERVSENVRYVGGRRRRSAHGNRRRASRARRDRSLAWRQERNLPSGMLCGTRFQSPRPRPRSAELARLMVEYRVPGLPVIGQGELVGIVTEADLIQREATVDMPSIVTFLDAVIVADAGTPFEEELRRVVATTAEELMTSPVISIRDSATVAELATLMLQQRINPVPVVDDARQIVGLATRSGLIELIARLESLSSPADSDGV